MLLPKNSKSSRRAQIRWLTSSRFLSGQAYQCYQTMLSVVLESTLKTANHSTSFRRSLEQNKCIKLRFEAKSLVNWLGQLSSVLVPLGQVINDSW
jgi:hypothetical protein